MFFSSTISPLLVASMALEAAAYSEKRSGRIFGRQYTINCPGRNEADKALIDTELKNAAIIAAYAAVEFDAADPNALYTSNFLPKSLQESFVTAQLKESYGNATIMQGGSDYTFTVTCDDTKTFCNNGYYASMSDGRPDGVMNVCSAWWDVAGTPAGKAKLPNLISTTDILAGCTGDSPKYKTLVDIQRGRAQVFLHELTHTTFFTKTNDKTIDFAYGVKKALNLAAGSRKMPTEREWKDGKKKTIPYCPDESNPPRPGYCDPNLAIDNADTLAIIAGGLYYSHKAQCNRQLPIGDTADPPPTKRLMAKTKRSSPVSSDDEILIDPPWSGLGFDSSTCDNPDANGCCGDCVASQPAAVTCQVGVSTTIGNCPGAIFTASATAAPPTQTAKVPGQGGVPGCAYVLSEDLGPQALCKNDYCNCGGTVAPLLTVSGKLGCAYPTQPATAQCPP